MKSVITLMFSCLLWAWNASAQCPQFVSCKAESSIACADSLNDVAFWNEPYYWDVAVGQHDLYEAATELEIKVKDLCNFNNLRVSYTILLDLDNDGLQETAVESAQLPPANTVFFDNAFNVSYSGGTARRFDERPVPPDEKYGFAAETIDEGDSVRTLRVRWATAANPHQYVLPRLPGGTHKIRWMLESGNVRDSCEMLLVVKDCSAPVLHCTDFQLINILDSGHVSLLVQSLVQQVQDNVTPENLIELGLRIVGTGTGFPTDTSGETVGAIDFTCNARGLWSIEVWAKDLAGNADHCTTTVYVDDVAGICGPSEPYVLQVCANTVQGNNGVSDVKIEISPLMNSLPGYYFSGNTNFYGCHSFWNLPLALNAVVVPQKNDNPLNGVSTYDLVLISKLITGQTVFSNPYFMVAADANRSKSVTTFDIITIRKLILGIYPEFPNTQSWRFIPKTYSFPAIGNPLQDDIPESIPITQAWGNPVEFVGVKIGDVNGTAIGNAAPEAVPDDRAPLNLLLPDIGLEAGETAEIPLAMQTAAFWSGCQFGLQFDENQLVVEAVAPGNLPGMEAASFGLGAGVLRCSWFGAEPCALSAGDRIATLHVRARVPLRLRDVIDMNDSRLHAEAYADETHPVYPLQLAFSTPTPQIISAVPNPTGGGARIPIELFQPGAVRLELRDLSGALCFKVEKTLDSGLQWLEIPAEVMPAAAVYIWSLLTDENHYGGKLIRQ